MLPWTLSVCEHSRQRTSGHLLGSSTTPATPHVAAHNRVTEIKADSAVADEGDAVHGDRQSARRVEDVPVEPKPQSMLTGNESCREGNGSEERGTLFGRVVGPLRVCAVVAATFCAVLFLTAGEAAEASSDEVVTRPSERVFVDPPDSVVAYLGAPPWGLANPMRVAVSAEEDHAYVMDFGAYVVRQFTLEGEFVRDYGTGEGRGPGEFLALSDVEVDPEGQVWTLDPVQGRVQVFDQAGEVLQTISTPGNATAFELTPSGDMVLMTLDSLLFRRVSRDGTVVRRFGRLIDDQYVNSIAVWGFIDASGSNVFYSGVYGGFLGRWSADDGDLHYLEPTVVEKPFPTPVRRDRAVMIVEEDRYGVSFGLSARRDTVYVLGHGEGKYVVDVYEAERGAYQYSIPIPAQSEAVSGISVTRDHLIVTADTLVTVWNRAN